MTNGLLDLPSHIRARLAKAIESGVLPMPCTGVALRSVLGTDEHTGEIFARLLELEQMGISRLAAAGWIRGVEEATSRALRPDLVWSGPEVPGLHARDTRRVYEELLGSAERSLLASTYVFVDGPMAFNVLACRMDERPDLRVTLLVNIQRKRGDVSTADQLVRKFADRFWGGDWPGSNRPSVFYDPRALEPEGPAGVLHAKAVVVDELMMKWFS